MNSDGKKDYDAMNGYRGRINDLIYKCCTSERRIAARLESDRKYGLELLDKIQNKDLTKVPSNISQKEGSTEDEPPNKRARHGRH